MLGSWGGPAVRKLPWRTQEAPSLPFSPACWEESSPRTGPLALQALPTAHRENTGRAGPLPGRASYITSPGLRQAQHYLPAPGTGRGGLKGVGSALEGKTEY